MGNKAIENTNPNHFVLFYDNKNQMIDLTQAHFVFLSLSLLLSDSLLSRIETPEEIIKSCELPTDSPAQLYSFKIRSFTSPNFNIIIVPDCVTLSLLNTIVSPLPFSQVPSRILKSPS